MNDVFGDVQTSFEDLPYGHHKVRISVLEKDGQQLIEDKGNGPRVAFKLEAVDGSGSIVKSQTFNGKRNKKADGSMTQGTPGILSGINACFGFTKEQANELVSVPPTDTTFDLPSLHRLCALWASSEGGWIEVIPNRDPKYTRPDVKFHTFEDGEPKNIKTAADYVSPAATNGSGDSLPI